MLVSASCLEPLVVASDKQIEASRFGNSVVDQRPITW